MGGETCDDCSQCIATEGSVQLDPGPFIILIPRQCLCESVPRQSGPEVRQALVRSPVPAMINSHSSCRSTWFTQKHVKQLQDYGINTVRIPVCSSILSISPALTPPFAARLLDSRRPRKPQNRTLPPRRPALPHQRSPMALRRRHTRYPRPPRLTRRPSVHANVRGSLYERSAVLSAEEL